MRVFYIFVLYICNRQKLKLFFFSEKHAYSVIIENFDCMSPLDLVEMQGKVNYAQLIKSIC